MTMRTGLPLITEGQEFIITENGTLIIIEVVVTEEPVDTWTKEEQLPTDGWKVDE